MVNSHECTIYDIVQQYYNSGCTQSFEGGFDQFNCLAMMPRDQVPSFQLSRAARQ